MLFGGSTAQRGDTLRDKVGEKDLCFAFAVFHRKLHDSSTTKYMRVGRKTPETLIGYILLTAPLSQVNVVIALFIKPVLYDSGLDLPPMTGSSANVVQALTMTQEHAHRVSLVWRVHTFGA